MTMEHYGKYFTKSILILSAFVTLSHQKSLNVEHPISLATAELSKLMPEKLTVSSNENSSSSFGEDITVSSIQLEDIAGGACVDIAASEQEWDMCMKKFINSRNKISSVASTAEVTGVFENRVTFKTRKAPSLQLVILVPENRNKTVIINYELMRPGQENGTIIVTKFGNYSLWSCYMFENGSHSEWFRGPDVSFKDIKYEYSVDIGQPKFVYNEATKKVDVTIDWQINGDIPSETDLTITNICEKWPLGLFFKEVIKPIQRSATIKNVPIDDNCQFKMFGQKNFEHAYKTPSWKSLNRTSSSLEVVTNISIEAVEASSSEWTVNVSWVPPSNPPARFEITLRSDKVYKKTLPGNQSEVLFENVKGEGLYNVSVTSLSINGSSRTNPLVAQAVFPAHTSWRSTMTTMLATWVLALATAVALVSTAVCWSRQQRDKLPRIDLEGQEDKLAKEFSLDVSEECGSDGWEVGWERVTLHEVVGEGAFGVVRRATLAPHQKEVAVKMLKDFPTLEEIRSFRAEMELMKSVGAHPHVVSLIGCCSGRKPLIVAEYCSRGDLLSFLRCSWDIMVSKRNAKYYNNNIDISDYRNDLLKKLQREDSKLVVNKLYDLQGICDAELTSLDLLSFCRQIAMGMEFLASNRVVHRDLAARNILVAGDRTLKIADFGLSRDVYQDNQYKQKGNGKMPVKWMALESLTHRIYTTQSDVWSFGVVVWEVVTLGGSPYPAVPAARLPRLLRDGYRMPRPTNCSKHLYELMLWCWRARPRDRPTFSDLHRKLDELLNSACADEYLSLELDDDPPPTPKPQRYLRMLLKGNRVWNRDESYERPLKAYVHNTPPQTNHYSKPPAPLTRTLQV